MKRREYYVYRYTLKDTKEVIYIGKTNASLKQRIDAHAKEPKFAPFLGKWDIDFVPLKNSVETDVVEKFLINKLKPCINEKDKVEGVTVMDITLPDWQPYSRYLEQYNIKINKLKELISAAKKKDDLLYHILNKENMFFSDKLYIDGTLPLKIKIEDCNGEHYTDVCMQILDANVTYTPSGYKYIILPQAEIFLNNENICQAEIWEEAANLFDFPETIEERLEYLDYAEMFADVLNEFKADKFYNETFGFGVLEIPEIYRDKLYFYKDMFPKYKSDEDKENNTLLELNVDKFGLIDDILNEIAKEKIKLYKVYDLIRFEDSEECYHNTAHH